MKIYSVSELHTELNQLFDQLPVVVEGEVQGAHVAQERFVWFDLKDATHVLSCFSLVFRTQVPLADGMRIRVTAKPKLFKKGKFVLDVYRVELVGEGSLRKAFELTKQKLEQEGLFAPERKRPLPVYPQQIGLITSPDAAAYTDVIRILKNRWTHMTVFFYPVTVQGPQAVNQLMSALQSINAEHPELDCVILTRGGGSLEDLQAFNHERVCRAVFASRIPVVCGVGHERDITLTDLTADVRASTPSNAAELTVPDKRDVHYHLTTLIQQLLRSCESLFRHHHERTDHALSVLEEISRHDRDQLSHLDRRLQVQLERFTQHIHHHLNTCNHWLTVLHALHPKHVLKRGYAIVQSHGKVLTSVQNLNTGTRLDTILADGSIYSTVQSIQRKSS